MDACGLDAMPNPKMPPFIEEGRCPRALIGLCFREGEEKDKEGGRLIYQVLLEANLEEGRGSGPLGRLHLQSRCVHSQQEFTIFLVHTWQWHRQPWLAGPYLDLIQVAHWIDLSIVLLELTQLNPYI